MKLKSYKLAAFIIMAVFGLWACGTEPPVDVEKIKSQPQTFVGSETCKQCHLEHYDSWKMTLHSRMLQDAREKQDAVIVEIDEKQIRESLSQLENLEVPAEEIYIPKREEIVYTVGSQWKQRFLVEKGGKLYIAPIEYNAETHQWVTYHASDWNKRPWLLKCGGCHATGVDLDKGTFVEEGVSCEACHGRGSWHAALPKTAVFQKRETIINPAKLTMGVAVQICGSCHNRGEATKVEGAGWAVGYSPGKALEEYFRSAAYRQGDLMDVYAEQFSQGHHQQYTDWVQSQHFTEGVVCTSCHYVHQIGLPATRSQTMAAGSSQCFECHEILNKTTAHAIHSFANCIGCHMPRVAVSEESGKMHSHVFDCLVPKDTIDNPIVPNSCTACHAHKYDNLRELQEKAFPGSMDAGGDW